MTVLSDKHSLPAATAALPGRAEAIKVTNKHFVHGTPIKLPFGDGLEQAVFGLGCFWGAERRFWQQDGVYSTAAGYTAGFTPNPSYEEVCSGLTGHTEAVLVVFDPATISYEQLLKMFWEAHDPTQGMQQGNDKGTQYRSGIYTFNEQQAAIARASLAGFEEALKAKGLGPITTEIASLEAFYYAENYHQQYLAKNPNGYCGLGGTGVCYPG